MAKANLIVIADRPTYTAGDTIQGQILADFAETLPALELQIELLGTEKVLWTPRGG